MTEFVIAVDVPVFASFMAKFPEKENWELNKMEELKNLTSNLSRVDMSNAKELITKQLERWRETKVNIAITGDSGVGKSRYINAIRG